MPRTKEQFEAMKEATNQKIRLSAVKLFVKKGFAATSIQDIANDAQISTGLMYRHYKSKEDLFKSLLAEVFDEIDSLSQLLDQHIAPLELVKLIAESSIQDLKKNDEFSQYVVTFAHMFIMRNEFTLLSDVEWSNKILKSNEIILKKMCNVIAKGQSTGVFKQGDPIQMTLFYFTILNGIHDMQFMTSILQKDFEFPFVAPSIDMFLSFLLEDDQNIKDINID